MSRKVRAPLDREDASRPETMARIIIAEALQDLSPEKLDTFRVRLRERRGDGPRLRRAHVDGTGPRELADLLVEAFSRRAVEVTLELLRAVGCTEAAEDLAEEAKVWTKPAPPRPAGPERPPAASGASAEPAKKEHFVDRHRKELTDRVSNINPILDLLLHHKVLGQEQYDEVRKISTKQEQIRFLYSGPLKSGGERSKDLLLTALEEEEEYLMEDLRKKEKV
ncbi:apoptosis-associated speck-like protein containing a CARD [Eucyclogobius newberryi]|uniref:apoptosis-associated speck-like protein containing a CARD n=1 Tax=Eucyclogobius newberryi TaxID=166745 RepID=UPI003B596159